MAEKPIEMSKEGTHEVSQLTATQKDPSNEEKAPYNTEIILATLPIPAKEDPMSKGPASLTTTST